MKRFLSLLALTILVVVSCSKYDDTELRNKVNGYESRIAALESLASYQTLLQKLEAGKTVTSYSKSDDIITLTFSDGSSVSFNQKGPKGDPGNPGESIQGDPGTPGQDGKTPEVKIENDKWYVRYGEDGAWKEIGSAIDRSLIKDIKAEGGVLKITLADGSIVNVPFGEKKGYELVLNRHVFTGYESQRSFILREIRVPYTLTGDLTNIDDVKFTFNVTDNSYSYIPDFNKAVTVEKTDAKTGFFVFRQKGFEQPNYSWAYFASYEDGEFYIDYPETHIDIIACFPDGYTRTDSLTILAENIFCRNDNDDYISVTETNGYPYVEIPATAGSYPMRIEVTVRKFELYDGPELEIKPLEDLFRVHANNLLLNGYTSPTTNVRTFENSGYTNKEFQYKFAIRYNANTSGNNRNAVAEIGIRTKLDKPLDYRQWVGLRFYQAK